MAPKTSNYGASYPDGAIIAHDGTVVNEADPDSDAPRYEDTRPTTETDGKQTADERGEDNAATTRRPTQDEQDAANTPEQGKSDEDEKSTVTPIKSAGARKATAPKSTSKN